jgi:hypothetical protein
VINIANCVWIDGKKGKNEKNATLLLAFANLAISYLSTPRTSSDLALASL